jgi:hypothetical protein
MKQEITLYTLCLTGLSFDALNHWLHCITRKAGCKRPRIFSFNSAKHLRNPALTTPKLDQSTPLLIFTRWSSGLYAGEKHG